MPSKKRKESHPVRMDNENEQGKTLWYPCKSISVTFGTSASSSNSKISVDP
jgi:hypothetical protein